MLGYDGLAFENATQYAFKPTQGLRRAPPLTKTTAGYRIAARERSKADPAAQEKFGYLGGKGAL